MQEQLGIAGSGAIACGLAATAARHGDVTLLARSDASAERATASIAKTCGKLGDDVDAGRVRVVTDVAELASATFLVEAVVEEHDHKVAVLRALAGVAGPRAVLATTTSSLSVGRLAEEAGVADRFVGLHVFNPVPRMELVELAFPGGATDEVRRAPARSARRWARRPSRSPTRRASSSTACCSRSSSARSTCSRSPDGAGRRRRLHAPRRRAPDGPARPAGLRRARRLDRDRRDHRRRRAAAALRPGRRGRAGQEGRARPLRLRPGTRRSALSGPARPGARPPHPPLDERRARRARPRPQGPGGRVGRRRPGRPGARPGAERPGPRPGPRARRRRGRWPTRGAILGRLEADHPIRRCGPAPPAARAQADVFLEWFDEVWKGPPNRLAAGSRVGPPGRRRAPARVDRPLRGAPRRRAARTCSGTR